MNEQFIGAIIIFMAIFWGPLGIATYLVYVMQKPSLLRVIVGLAWSAIAWPHLLCKVIVVRAEQETKFNG